MIMIPNYQNAEKNEQNVSSETKNSVGTLKMPLQSSKFMSVKLEPNLLNQDGEMLREYFEELKLEDKNELKESDKEPQHKKFEETSKNPKNIENEQISPKKSKNEVDSENSETYGQSDAFVFEEEENSPEDEPLGVPEENNFIFSDNDEDSPPSPHKPTPIIFEDLSSNGSPTQTLKDPHPHSGPSEMNLFGEVVRIENKHQEHQNGNPNEKNYGNPNEKNFNFGFQCEQQTQQSFGAPMALLQSFTPLPPSTFAKLVLIRYKEKDGLLLIARLESNKRFIVGGKESGGRGVLLSNIENTFVENGEGYQGKAKTSFFGNEVQFYSAGVKPDKNTKLLVRENVCSIITENQTLIEEIKPRDFVVYLLKPGFSYYRDLAGVDQTSEIPLHKLYHSHPENQSKIFYFQNRKSKWNEKEKMHSLNMKGRAKVPSIKNFILENPSDNNREVMLFGKMDTNVFSFDIHYPLSPNIAMAIAISSFCYKSW